MRRRGRRRGGITTLTAGLIALVLIVIVTYMGFTKFADPFATPYTIHAIVANANQIQPQSWVRIAGVNVGKVDSVQPADNCKSISSSPGPCSTADVTMEIQNQGLPIHKDATFAIRPRIFLEGNFFIDLKPGTPEAPVAPSGYVFPIQATTVPVQTDQVLTSLQADTRRNLQILLQQYGLAVSKAGPSYNRSIQYWLPAYEYSSIVAHDSLGIQPHDLSNWLYKSGDVSAALDTHPQNLENLVTDFNTTANAFARQSANLQAAVAELPKTLAVALPAFNALNSAFCSGPAVPNCSPGPLRQFAKALIPGVQSTTGMVNASLPFITQLRLLVQPSELGGLSTDLKNTIPSLTQLTKETIPLLKNQVRPVSSCVANVISPWSHLTINDPHFNASNGFPPHQVYVEQADYLPGLAGESRDFDANGYYIRVLTSLGNTGVTSLQSGLIGGTLAPLVGEQPQVPPMTTSQAKTAEGRPPFAGGGPDAQGDVPNYPCETQPAITEGELNSASTTPPPTSYPLVGTLPTSLVTSLLNSLPPLQKILARDVAKHKRASAYQPLTPAQRAADLKTIFKYGVFANVPKGNSATSTTTKKASGSKASKKS
jgi:phospholipid/cholesterol/gamma-HCH transport system substrate-binding protein